jgi:anti-sigma28 factor (negative regulator of flagellin synthesis)
MTITAISGSSPVATATSEQQHQPKTAASAAPAAKAETVSISKQAQQLASDGDRADQEFAENAAEKASETLKGKK